MTAEQLTEKWNSTVRYTMHWKQEGLGSGASRITGESSGSSFQIKQTLLEFIVACL